MKNLSHIKNILFDCDGVLYSDLEAVFGQVSRKMTEYISNKLNVDLKKAFFKSTLSLFEIYSVIFRLT